MCVIDEVGDGVEPHRVGQRVWVWGAQSYRPMGTAAEFTVRLLGSDDFPTEAKHAAAAALTAAARDGALSIPVSEPLPLDAIARAHDMVDAGGGGRLLLTLE